MTVAKPWEQSYRWSAAVSQEFFQQGDREAAAGIPVEPFMDRKKSSVEKNTANFIKYATFFIHRNETNERYNLQICRAQVVHAVGDTAAAHCTLGDANGRELGAIQCAHRGGRRPEMKSKRDCMRALDLKYGAHTYTHSCSARARENRAQKTLVNAPRSNEEDDEG